MTILAMAVVVAILAWLAWDVAGAPEQAADPRPQPDYGAGPQENPEKRLAESLLAGEIDRDAYRDAMARLAAAADLGSGAEVTSPCQVGFDQRALLGRLHARLPELPTPALSTACLLARMGASADDLIRVLDLTRQQAVTIVTNTRMH